MWDIYVYTHEHINIHVQKYIHTCNGIPLSVKKGGNYVIGDNVDESGECCVK